VKIPRDSLIQIWSVVFAVRVKTGKTLFLVIFRDRLIDIFKKRALSKLPYMAIDKSILKANP